MSEGATIVIDSVTRLGAEARGAVVLAASHAGTFAAYLAAKAGVRGVILNDAGIGRERAGVAGLDYLDRLALPAAAVSHRSARIGWGEDMPAGVISTVNGAAAELGLEPGQSAAEAARLLAAAPLRKREPPPEAESRFIASPAGQGKAGVIVLDSVSLVEPTDAAAILCTGSHGGLLGGRPETAVKVGVFAALYNDADLGREGAGISRLPALDARGIAGATVSAFSARIGNGRSTLDDGFISHVNGTARQRGAAIGMSAKEFAAAMQAAFARENR